MIVSRIDATQIFFRTEGHSIKPGLDSGLWTLDSALQIFSQHF